MTDINTRLIALIGSPLSQSFAARMQNKAYEVAGVNMKYFYVEAGSEHLEEIINGIRYMPCFAGAAVTKPNKIKVLEYLDELDPLCREIGACNTVVKQPDGRLKGYNTDGTGFITSLKAEMGTEDLSGLSFFCFGAGGAGRAICSALAHCGVKKIYVSSLTPESRERLVNDINSGFAPVAEAVGQGDFSRISVCDVIMNTTGVGMGNSIGESPLPREHMVSGKLFFDACYNPAKTRFLLDAEDAGNRILNGLGMSLYQGAEQFGLWTGKRAPVEAMRNELTDIINGK